jgi:site-specific recombinase XerD
LPALPATDATALPLREVHMLRHACGFKLANDGHDTRAIQAYLGHRSIVSTVRYTAMTPNRFKHFWKD